MSDLSNTMKGVLLLGHGGPEMLEYRDDIQVPTPSADEVLIRVSAAGVNNTDVNTRIGGYSKTWLTILSKVKLNLWLGNHFHYQRSLKHWNYSWKNSMLVK